MTLRPYTYGNADEDIRKSDIRQFLDDLEKQAHPLYATVRALPESAVWIMQDDTGEKFPVAGFIENYDGFDSSRDTFSIGFNAYFFRDEWDDKVPGWELTDNPYNGEDRYEVISRNELTVAFFTGEFARLLAYVCREAILKNDPLGATPETAAKYGLNPEDMEALGGGIAECNRRIIAELRNEYERLKAIDCLHSSCEERAEQRDQ